MPKRNGKHAMTAAQIREALFGKNETQPLRPAMVRVETPEWEGRRIDHVNVRKQDAHGWMRMEEFIEKLNAKQDRSVPTMIRLSILGCCDDSGRLLFKDEDFDKLLEMDSAPFIRCGTELLSFMGFTQDEVDEKRKN